MHYKIFVLIANVKKTNGGSAEIIRYDEGKSY